MHATWSYVYGLLQREVESKYFTEALWHQRFTSSSLSGLLLSVSRQHVSWSLTNTNLCCSPPFFLLLLPLLLLNPPLIVHTIILLFCSDNCRAAITVICSNTHNMQSDSARMVPSRTIRQKHVGPIWSFPHRGDVSGAAGGSQGGWELDDHQWFSQCYCTVTACKKKVSCLNC